MIAAKEIWTALLLAASLCVPAAAASINPELMRLETGLESELQHKLDELTTGQGRILISLVLEEKERRKRTMNPDADALVDLAYVPIPVDDLLLLADANSGPKIEIESADVSLLISGTVSASLVSTAREMIASRLEKFGPNISIIRAPSENPRNIASAQVPSTPAPLAPIVAPQSELRARLETLEGWLRLLGPALVVFLGIALIARSLGALAQSLGSWSHAATALPSPSQGQQKKTVAEPASHQHGPQATSSHRNTGRNLALVRRILEDDPILFCREIKTDAADLAGLKALLPSLSENEMAKVRELLGKDRLRLVAARMESDFGRAASFEPWLESFAQRLCVQRLRGDSPLTKALGAERIRSLSLLSTEELWQAARDLGDRATWRLLAELSDSSALADAFARVPMEQWSGILSAGEVSIAQVQAAADRLAAEAGKRSAETPASAPAHEYTARLLEPIASALNKKDLAGREEGLARLGACSPELAEQVSHRVWTAKRLDTVPRDYLAETLSRCSYTQVASLLYTLPEKQAALLTELIAKGKLRAMALDQCQRMRARSVDKEKTIASEIASAFLESLRVEASQGKFIPISDPPALEVSEPWFPEKAAA